MKPILYIIVILCFFQCNVVFSQKPDLRFKSVSAVDGLSHNFIRKVIQDHKGYMWFASIDGLNKFDGYTSTIYKSDPANRRSLVSNDIYEVFEDSRKNLWVGTGKGLNLYDREKDDFQTDSTLSGRFINKIYEDSSHNLWVSSHMELFLYNWKKRRFEKFDIEGLGGEIIFMYQDKKGEFLLGSWGGIWKLDVKSHKASPHEFLQISTITSVFEDSRNNYVVTSREEGLLIYDKVTRQSKRYRYDVNNKNGIPSSHILSILEDSVGRYWMGTENGGLIIFDKDKEAFYNYMTNEADGEALNSSTIYSVYEDNQKNLWLGTFSGGVNILKKKKFRHFKKDPLNSNSLSHNNVTFLIEDKKGNIWLGTDGGGLNKFDKSTGAFKHYRFDPKNPKSIGSDVVTYIQEDQKGNIWLGFWAGGIDKFDVEKNEFIHYRKDYASLTTSILDENVVELYEDKRGNLWVGTASGLTMFNRDKNVFEHYNIPGSGLEQFTADILEDSFGNFWVSTFHGLYLFDRDTKKTTPFFHNDTIKNSLSDNLSLTLFEDSKNNLWVGTAGGLNLFNRNDRNFTIFRKKDGLPSDAIYGIVEDKSGLLWISTSNGISKFDPINKTFKNYNVSDGLQGNLFKENACMITKSGEIFFGGPNGFNYFNPSEIKDNTFLPSVYFTNFQVFNKPVSIGGESPLQKHISETKEIVLSYKESVLSFDFAALNLTSPEKNQYAFMLEGLENEWNYVGNKRSATYTNLDPGQYSLKVKASNNDGIWNESPTTLKIIVTPPFWQTWYFRGFVFLFVIGSAVTFYRVRMKAIKAQKAELEKQVAERTAEVVLQKEELAAQAENLQAANAELEEHREEIETQRDTLEKINENIMSSIKYAYAIQQAILPGINTIKDPNLDLFVIYKPKDVVSGDFYWFTHLTREEYPELENDLTFVAAVDCTGHGVPGAFMSIIGSMLLNEIIKQKHIFDPATILEKLDVGVRNAVSKAVGVNTASMELGLICIKNLGDNVEVLFSGAKRPLIYIEKGSNEIVTLDSTRRCIGGESKKSNSFVTEQVIIEKETVLYLTTDGFSDQNNPQREKMGSRRLKEIMTELSQYPFDQQKELFEKELLKFQNGAEQRDDITLIGLALK